MSGSGGLGNIRGPTGHIVTGEGLGGGRGPGSQARQEQEPAEAHEGGVIAVGAVEERADDALQRRRLRGDEIQKLFQQDILGTAAGRSKAAPGKPQLPVVMMGP